MPTAISWTEPTLANYLSDGPKPSNELERIRYLDTQRSAMKYRLYTCHPMGWMCSMMIGTGGKKWEWEPTVYNEKDREIVLDFIKARKALGKAVGKLFWCGSAEECYTIIESLFPLAKVINQHKFFEAVSVEELVNKVGCGGVRMNPYTPPWEHAEWWVSSKAKLLHGIHPSTEHPGSISYYPDRRHYLIGRTVAVRPGRYLAKYFGKGTPTNLGDTDVRTWAAQFVNSVQGHVLHLTEPTTDKNRDEVADKWYLIYQSGPGTCMKGDSAFSVRIYAYPGNTLRLAYLTANEKPDGEPIARCIVRDDEMQYLRIYPDDGGTLWQDMKNKLGTAGYKHGNLDGVKLALVKKNGDVVCPYIDCGVAGTQSVSVERRYLICGEDGYDATMTHGLLSDEDDESFICEACEDRYPDDEACSANDDGPYCQSCFNDIFVRAYGRRGMTYIARDNAVCCKSNGECYDVDYAGAHDVYQCEFDGEYYHISDLVEVYGDRFVNKKNAEPLDVADSEGHGWAYPDETTRTVDGRVILSKEAVEIVPKTKTHILHCDDDPGEFFPSMKETEVEGETA